MKKWYNETINNRYFEVNKVDKVNNHAIGYRDIDDCYGRPSQTKCNIWNSWEDWFHANDGYCTIDSYNSMIFTIKGYFTDKETSKKYYAYITPAHNKCWEVVEG